MPTITFNVSSKNLIRIKAAMKGLYPIPKTDGVSDFTNGQWAKEAIRLLIIKDVLLWEHRQARKAIDIKADDNLLS